VRMESNSEVWLYSAFTLLQDGTLGFHYDHVSRLSALSGVFGGHSQCIIEVATDALSHCHNHWETGTVYPKYHEDTS
jgi:hypothetical protein